MHIKVAAQILQPYDLSKEIRHPLANRSEARHRNHVNLASLDETLQPSPLRTWPRPRLSMPLGELAGNDPALLLGNRAQPLQHGALLARRDTLAVDGHASWNSVSPLRLAKQPFSCNFKGRHTF